MLPSRQPEVQENDLPARILVVDDDPTICSLLALVIRRTGFEVDAAGDGVEALSLLREHHYAVAVVDLMMPRLDGYGLVEAIKQLGHRPSVLVATAMTDAFITGLDASVVSSIIRKPFDIEMIASLVGDMAESLAQGDFAARLVQFPAATAVAE